MYCYCDATQTQAARVAARHAITRPRKRARPGTATATPSWDDVEPPPNFGGYSESLDWLQFRIDNAFDLLHWRSELFRKLDPKHLIAAHGVAGTLESLPSSAQ